MVLLVEREAAEQPERVAAVLGRHDEFAAIARSVRERFDDVLLVARGSSDNAARYAQYVLGARNGLLAALAAPSLFTRMGGAIDLSRTLTIAISQSGASPDVAAVITEARRQGAPTLALTNDDGSLLAGAAEHVFDLEAGAENAIAATKTYTCSLAAIALLSEALLGTRAEPALVALPDAMQAVIDDHVPTGALRPWTAAQRGIVVGRGFDFATAHETALKLQELGGVIAQGHSAADVRHGPIGGLTGAVPTIVFATEGDLADDVAAAAATLASRGPLLSVGSLQAVHANADHVWSLPEVPAWVAPLVHVVAGQRLAIALAIASGRDPDHPVGLDKVTRTH